MALEDLNPDGCVSGREALALLEADDGFDRVFCDLMLADMSGMDLSAQLAQKLVAQSPPRGTDPDSQ